MKKTLSFVLALTMVLTLLPIAALAASYKDTETAWGSDAIERWTGEGVVNGKADNNFDPNGPLKRAEAAMIYSRLLKLEDKSELTFPDVPENAWYADAIARNVAAGIFGGTDIGMEPEKAITREAMIVTLARVLGVPSEETCNKEFTDYEETSAWARGAVNAMVNMGVIGGVSADKLAPKHQVSRQQAVVMLDRLITAYITEDGTRTIAGTDGRYTLLVAKNVSLTGPYNGTPVVIYAKDGKVSMGTVTGTATYYVMVSGVAVTGAAPGTTFVVGPNATGLTVNGVPVAPNSTYVVPYYSYNPVIPTEYTFKLVYDKNAPDGVTVTGTIDDDTATSTTNAAHTFTVTDKEYAAEGYKFNGWNTAANGSGDPYSAGKEIAVQPDSTVTLYAQWVKEDEPVTYTYKLVYDKNAPEGVTVTGTIDDDTATSTTDAPHTFTVTDKEYAADGYDFTGWKDSKGTSYAAQDTIDVEPNSTVTLYAQWEKKIVYHTVTYTDAAGKTLTSETLPEGSTHTVLSDAAAKLTFDDNEQKFAGWLDSATRNIYTAGMTFTVTANVTLKAQLVDLKDLIGLAISSALGYVREKATAKADLLTREGEYTFSVDPTTGIELPAAPDAGKTRNGKIAGSASVEEGVVVHAITWASQQAIKLLGGTPTGEEVGSVVDTVIDQLGDAGIDVDPVEGNRDKLKAIKDAVLAEAKEQARIILGKFKEGGNYVFDTVTVTVGGHSVELDPLTKRPTEGTRREKAIELATAFAREVYNSLKKYDEKYVDVVDITVPVKVEFTASDNTAISIKTNEYAYKYDFTLEAKLNSNGMVYFKYDGEYGHVVYTVGEKTKTSYEENIADIVDATLDSEEFQANIGEAVNESVAKFTNSDAGVFAKLKALLERDDLDIDASKIDIDGALKQWMTDNNLTAEGFGKSPLFDELWNGNDAVYNHQAIYDLIEDVAEAVGEAVTKQLADKLGENPVGQGLFRYLASVVGPDNLSELLADNGIEFDTGMGQDHPEIDKYILAKICDAIVAKAQEDPDFEGRDPDDKAYEDYDTETLFTAAKAAIGEVVEEQLDDVMADYTFFTTLAKFKTIDTASTISLGELKTLLNDPTLRDIVPQSVTNRIPRLKNALNRIPEGYTVTVTTDDGVEHTLTSDEIKALKDAASLTEELNKLVTDTNKDLTLGHFDTPDGLKVTLTRETNGTRTFVFYLWLDLDGSKEFLK